MKYNQKVTDYIEKAGEDQIAILETLRKLIHEYVENVSEEIKWNMPCLLYTSPSPRDRTRYRMPSSA